MGANRSKKKRSKLATSIVILRDYLDENVDTFGARFLRSGRTVEDWEQDRRTPDPLVIRMLDKLVKKYL